MALFGYISTAAAQEELDNKLNALKQEKETEIFQLVTQQNTLKNQLDAAEKLSKRLAGELTVLQGSHSKLENELKSARARNNAKTESEATKELTRQIAVLTRERDAAQQASISAATDAQVQIQQAQSDAQRLIADAQQSAQEQVALLNQALNQRIRELDAHYSARDKPLLQEITQLKQDIGLKEQQLAVAMKDTANNQNELAQLRADKTRDQVTIQTLRDDLKTTQKANKRLQGIEKAKNDVDNELARIFEFGETRRLLRRINMEKEAVLSEMKGLVTQPWFYDLFVKAIETFRPGYTKLIKLIDEFPIEEQIDGDMVILATLLRNTLHDPSASPAGPTGPIGLSELEKAVAALDLKSKIQSEVSPSEARLRLLDYVQAMTFQ